MTANVNAAFNDAESVLIPSNYPTGSTYCDDKPHNEHRRTIDCAGLNKVALNSFATGVDWEYGSANLFSYGSDASESNSMPSPKASPANGASVVSAAQQDSPALTEISSAPGASLSLDEGMRSDVDTGSDTTISEPLLTSILALIAIVAVARRNVSGA